MVIPFAAGGPTDVLGRVVGARMAEILGQQVVIENVGGAGGMTGSKRVVDAQPDGYVMGIGTVGTHAQGQTLYKRPLYNSQTDFTPVALLAQVPIVLTARKDLPVKDFKEFVAYAKANQTKMQFGSAGAGSATHLGCVLLNYMIGVNITHVPYRGTGPAMQDLIGGRIDYQCLDTPVAIPQIESGTVKAIAIFTRTRSPSLPELASAHEQGLTDFEASNWIGLFLPKDTPLDIVARFHAAAVATMDTPSIQERLRTLGAVVVTPGRRSPGYLQKFVVGEIEKWAAPIKASGVSSP
jgi:tripartite-type tricarboxylate transporter receptor subunit TctC